MDLSLLVVLILTYLKTLNETATANIKVRVCSDQGLPNENTPQEIIHSEMHVK